MTWQLHQFPLCPFSRKVRLLMTEKGLAFELRLEHPWQQADAFLALNAAGQTPVLVEPLRNHVLADSVAICEYIEEVEPTPPMLGAAPRERAEVRRLVGWFDQKFYNEVGALLLKERMYHRLVTTQAPNPAALRQAHKAADQHLDYIAWLLDQRRWLAGGSFSLADMAAAAHLSVADYLGGIDWRTHEQVKMWYSAVKSRPSFRPFLGERMVGITPPAHYDALDF